MEVESAKDDASQSCWRVVEAKVRVSLPPAELGATARAAATRRAFSRLLMRYSGSLGGVVIAQRGGLRFSSRMHAALMPATPFAHIVGRATLLVFAPVARAVMTGDVVHIGPDHVGMALWDTFHVVLARSETAQQFEYVGTPRMWRWKTRNQAHDDILSGDSRDMSQEKKCQGEDAVHSNHHEVSKDIVMGSRVRFAVVALRHTLDGLYHIEASLLDMAGNYSRNLGVIATEPVSSHEEQNNGVQHRADEDNMSDHDDIGSLLTPIAPMARSRRGSMTPLQADAVGFNDPLAMYLSENTAKNLTSPEKVAEPRAPVQQLSRNPQEHQSRQVTETASPTKNVQSPPRRDKKHSSSRSHGVADDEKNSHRKDKDKGSSKRKRSSSERHSSTKDKKERSHKKRKRDQATSS